MDALLNSKKIPNKRKLTLKQVKQDKDLIELPIIFKENALGAVISWSIKFDPKSKNIIINFGQVDGKIQTDMVEVIPKANRTLKEQAILEMNSRFTKKKREGYDEQNVKPPLKGPMLAKKYEPKKNDLKFPLGLTTKIDGIRCLSLFYNGKIRYYSRNNVEWKHFSDIFDSHLESFLSYLPKGLTLDGELYSPNINFNKISSIVKKDKNTKPDDIRKYIKYYIFDTNEEVPYENRWVNLMNAYKKYIKNLKKGEDFMIVVMNTYWAKTPKDIEIFHKYVTNLGFEGTMIRKLYSGNKTEKGYTDSLYVPGRGNRILKHKDIQDEEAEIIDVISGRGRDSDLALIKLKDKRGNIFTVKPSATNEVRKKWLKNPSLILGKMMTFEFQELTEKGVPRFPRGKAIRDYE